MSKVLLLTLLWVYDGTIRTENISLSEHTTLGQCASYAMAVKEYGTRNLYPLPMGGAIILDAECRGNF